MEFIPSCYSSSYYFRHSLCEQLPSRLISYHLHFLFSPRRVVRAEEMLSADRKWPFKVIGMRSTARTWYFCAASEREMKVTKAVTQKYENCVNYVSVPASLAIVRNDCHTDDRIELCRHQVLMLNNGDLVNSFVTTGWCVMGSGLKD